MILELSKLTMHSFYYEKLSAKLACPVIVCYFHTDSFILGQFCKDFVDHLHEVADNHLDLSSFEPAHPLYSDKNRGKLGAFKSETSSAPIEEFIGLKAKMYSIKLSKEKQTAQAEGIKRHTVHGHPFMSCIITRYSNMRLYHMNRRQ